MRLQFQGAASTVTGSIHLLTVGGDADRNELLRSIGAFPAGTLKGVYLVHSDPDQSELPGAGLRESGFLHVGIPARGDESLLV